MYYRICSSWYPFVQDHVKGIFPSEDVWDLTSIRICKDKNFFFFTTCAIAQQRTYALLLNAWESGQAANKLTSYTPSALALALPRGVSRREAFSPRWAQIGEEGRAFCFLPLPSAPSLWLLKPPLLPSWWWGFSIPSEFKQERKETKSTTYPSPPSLAHLSVLFVGCRSIHYCPHPPCVQGSVMGSHAPTSCFCFLRQILDSPPPFLPDIF